MTYNPSLDGIRGIAVILVILLHVQVFIYHNTPVFGWLDFSGGFLGVDIFFVLSGFLITGLLIHEYQQTKSISLKNFYLRRVLRLIPALVLLLLVTILYAAIFLAQEVARQTIMVSGLAILYLTNWAFAFHWVPGSDLLGHLWSLSVEEQFYLLWPVALVVLFTLKLPRRMIIVATMAAIVFICLHRIDLLSEGAQLSRVYPASDVRAECFFVWCLNSPVF
jgi:peptidoglycan/LPS O-acetylase OafA/YrhL